MRCLPTDGSAGGGIAHAARAVTEEIVRQWEGEVVLYVPRGCLMGKVAAEPQPYTDVLRESSSHQIVWLEGNSRRSLKRGLVEHPCDLLFVPSGAISPGLGVVAIPWVHDCDIFDHPEWFPQSWIKREMTTRMFLRGIRKAPIVFAVSEYTKASVARLSGIPAEQIVVTGEGGDKELAEISINDLSRVKKGAVERLRSLGITRRFVLVLGTLEPRKNIPLICRIWPEVTKAVPDIDLVIAGQDGWKTVGIHAAIKTLGSRVHLIQKTRDSGQIEFTEDYRRDLLLAADLVLVPSCSEGFGLVALEAIQAGTPVITSNRGALPEVVGAGEWLLDPEDKKAWQEMVIRLLKDDTIHQEVQMQQSGRRKLFSWEATTRIILNMVS